MSLGSSRTVPSGMTRIGNLAARTRFTIARPSSESTRWNRCGRAQRSEHLAELVGPAGPVVADDVDGVRSAPVSLGPRQQRAGDGEMELLIGRLGRPHHVVVGESVRDRVEDGVAVGRVAEPTPLHEQDPLCVRERAMYLGQHAGARSSVQHVGCEHERDLVPGSGVLVQRLEGDCARGHAADAVVGLVAVAEDTLELAQERRVVVDGHQEGCVLLGRPGRRRVGHTVIVGAMTHRLHQDSSIRDHGVRRSGHPRRIFGRDRTTSYPAHASVPHLRQAGEDAFARDKGDMMQFTTNAEATGHRWSGRRHVRTPVHMTLLHNDGVSAFIDCGPGRDLVTYLVSRDTRDRLVNCEVVRVENPGD